jgi:hypothetical protein
VRNRPHPKAEAASLTDANDSAPRRQIDRALPGWCIDLIRDGVTNTDLKASGDRAVWRALRRTALSAQHRAWSVMEWEALILEPRSVLGRQLATKGGKTRTPKAVQRALSSAWDSAWGYRTQDAPFDRERAREEAERRANAARTIAADLDNDLRDPERAVLALAADLSDQRGLPRVALPWREAQRATGLSERSTKNALRGLAAKGVLVLVERGRAAGGKSTKGAKANLYALPDSVHPHVKPGDPACGTPVPSTVGPLDETADGTPAFNCGTPDTENRTEKEADVVTLTVSSKDPKAIAEAIRHLVVLEHEAAHDDEDVELPDNVSRLDRKDRPA